MLSISDSRYRLPVKTWRDTVCCWVVDEKASKHSMLCESPFNFTISLRTSEPSVKERFTVIYDGIHVKPSGRTLRKFGVNMTSELVKILSQVTKTEEIEYAWWQIEDLCNREFLAMVYPVNSEGSTSEDEL